MHFDLVVLTATCNIAVDGPSLHLVTCWAHILFLRRRFCDDHFKNLETIYLIMTSLISLSELVCPTLDRWAIRTLDSYAPLLKVSLAVAELQWPQAKEHVYHLSNNLGLEWNQRTKIGLCVGVHFLSSWKKAKYIGVQLFCRLNILRINMFEWW